MTTADRAGEGRARLAQIEREILARRPEHAIDPTLDRISALVTLLGDPQRAYPVIHVTGTNGKTSTARMIESLLRARGLRTGLFTSPHLTSIRERIRIDGEPVSADSFIAAYDEIKPYLDVVDAQQVDAQQIDAQQIDAQQIDAQQIDAQQPVQLSFFEVFTGMAFAMFADAPVDVAIIEVGMGGTWDSTNVADGTVAVVTPISLDHTRWLGDTVEEIAADKAGIIKPGAIAVLAQQPPAAAEALLRRAAEVGASVAREGIEFGVVGREQAVGGQQVSVRGLLGDYPDLFLPLFGAHQAGNLACAIAAVEAFARGDAVGAATSEDAELNGHEPEVGELAPRTATMTAPGALDLSLVRDAAAAMTSPGRLEVLRRSPVVIVDAAHNPAGMAATVEALEESFSFTSLIAVVAIAADKDVPTVLDQLEPVATALVATTNSSGRAMPAAELGELAESVFGPDRVRVAPRLDDAIELGVALADEADAEGEGAVGGMGGAGLLITGSVITAGEARLLLAGAASASAGGATP